MDNSNSGGEPEQMRKMFLGGLSFDTTEESVQGYFEKFGEITDCCVVRHKDGERKPRGFGFVTYAKSSCVDKVIEAKKENPHVLDGREIDVKRALPKEVHEGGSKESTNKAFVGGLAPGTTTEELKAYFSKYGTVNDVSIPASTEGKKRVFGFVTFEDSDTVDKLIILQNFQMNGRNLEVKKAQNKDRMGRGGFGGRDNRGRDFGGGFGGGYSGGRGRGRGGYRNGGGDQGGYGGGRYGGGGGYSGGGGGSYGGGSSYGGGYGGSSGGGYGGGYGGNSGGGYNDFGSGYNQQSSSGPMRSGGGGGGYGGRSAPYSGSYGGGSNSGGYGGGGNYSSGGNTGYSGGGGSGGGYGGGYGGNSGGRNY